MALYEVTRSRYRPDRDEYILSMVRDKRVLHIGAADWPFTQEKQENGTLLYQRIDAVACEQIGIDNDAESVALLKNDTYAHSRMLVHDFNAVHTLNVKVDVIVFGETLEHLMNLEVAISNLKAVMKSDTQLVISVPNAMRALNFFNALLGREQQHPDHSVAFTYKTLLQLLEKNDLHVAECLFTGLRADAKRFNWRGKIAFRVGMLIGALFPLLAPTILVVARTKE